MANVRPLNDALKEIARLDLNEVESQVPKDIAALRIWIKKQPHLRACNDDQYLLAFLRASKHSLEKAKSKIDYFYTIKTFVPEMFRNMRMNEKYIEFASRSIFIWPPIPENSGSPAVAIARFENFDSKQFTLLDVLRYRTFFLEWAVRENDNCMVAGYVEIIDLKKIPYSLYTRIDFALVKKLSVFGKKAVPLRYKGIHLLNFRTEFTEVLNYVKLLLPEKYRKRMYVHKTLEDLYEHVPKEYLPQEYGGTNGSIDEITKENLQDMLAVNDFLILDDRFGVDEQLRPNKQPMNVESLFGLQGSFRKLDID